MNDGHECLRVDTPLSEIVSELRTLAEKASEPPWRANGLVIDGPCTPKNRIAAMVVTTPGFRPRSEIDAALIVAAVNALPRLLSAAEQAERMKASRDRWKALACSAPDAFHAMHDHAPRWMEAWDAAILADENDANAALSPEPESQEGR